MCIQFCVKARHAGYGLEVPKICGRDCNKNLKKKMYQFDAKKGLNQELLDSESLPFVY